MKEYKFAEYPSNSSVSSGVTLAVAMWFLVAAGAILADPVSPYTQRALAEANQPTAYAQEAAAPAVVPASLAIAPEARFTITVEASRSATL